MVIVCTLNAYGTTTQPNVPPHARCQSTAAKFLDTDRPRLARVRPARKGSNENQFTITILKINNYLKYNSIFSIPFGGGAVVREAR